MAVLPGATSGTFNFALSNGGVIQEAFDRIQIEPPQITRHRLISARNSLNLEMIEWENQGFNFWKTTSGTIPLVAGQAVYTLPPSLVTLEEVWYSTVNGGGLGMNTDRILTPMTRTDYAQRTNKLQGGIPTQYWFQMISPPQVTLWQVPTIGAPNYVINWYGLQQMQDAGLGGGEAPDVLRRCWDALCAGMAKRLAQKFAPSLYAARKDDFADAWGAMTRRDQEPGPTTYQVNPTIWARMG